MHIFSLTFTSLLFFSLGYTTRTFQKCCPNGHVLNDHGECVVDFSTTNFPSVSPIEIRDSGIVNFSDNHGVKCDYWNAMLLFWNSTDRFVFNDNGTVTLKALNNKKEIREVIFENGEFCADLVLTSRKKVVKLCPCDRLICLRKCCPAGQVYNFSSGPRCVNGSEWQPHLITSSIANNLTYVVLDNRMPKCEGFHNFVSTKFVPPHLLNGFWWDYPNGKAFQGCQLCKDLIYSGPHEISVICENVSAMDRILKYVWHIPAAALHAATLATLLLCPQLRAGTHGRALLCHTSALLVVNIVLACNAKHAFFGIRHEAYVVIRKAADVVVHYAIWASAFWLNSICINIGLGFRTDGTMRSPTKERRNFLFFSLYSWLVPACITTVVVVLRALPNSYVPFLYKPTMIETRSGHYELEGLLRMTSFAYYFAPISVLLIINLIMFAFTTSKVFELRKASKILRKCQVSNSNGVGDKKKENYTPNAPTEIEGGQSNKFAINTKSMLLYVRLLWMMGVLEMVVEIATWATSHFFWYEATMDVVDLLRAGCVFWLTCCKRRVLDLACRRLRGCALPRRLRASAAARGAGEHEMRSAGSSSAAACTRSSKTSSGAAAAAAAQERSALRRE